MRIALVNPPPERIVEHYDALGYPHLGLLLDFLKLAWNERRVVATVLVKLIKPRSEAWRSE